MLGLAFPLRAAIDAAASEIAVRAPAPSRRLALAAGLLSLLLSVALCQGLLTNHSPFAAPRASLAPARSLPVSGTGLSRLPLAAQASVSQALGAEDPAYRIGGSGDGLAAANPGGRLVERFARSGVSVEAGSTRVGLGLRAVRYGRTLRTLGTVAPRARANRVVYARPGITESYVNGPIGLEQGFTIQRAAVEGGAGALTLAMALTGKVHPSLGAGGQSVTLAGVGTRSLRYAGLEARDASERPLRSSLALNGREILLRVDTRGARYPLRIDPFIQQGEKFTGAGETGDTIFGGVFGYSVALSSDGNTAVIGGLFDHEGAGAAWVFTRSGSTWTQQGEKLTPKSGEEIGAGGFGSGVAISAAGNTALIGAVFDDKGGGSAWVFTRSGSTWTQQGEKITAKGTEETGEGAFGQSVALSADGNTALIGAGADHKGAGAAWAFTRSGSTWTQQGEKITPKSGEEKGAGAFGESVALSSDGNTGLVGADGEANRRGAAWAFTRSGAVWTQQGEKITPNSGEEKGAGAFGESVALSSDGNTALVGAGSDSGGVGAAWALTRSGSTWIQEGEKITAKSGEVIDEGAFGNSVALSSDGSTALIGGFFDNNGVGAAWVFVNQLTTATISLVNTAITVDRRGRAAIMLTCTGTAPFCGATLTLTAQRELWSGWSQDDKTVTVVIGTASASVSSGETTTVDVHLNHRGRKLLNAGDGHLPATLRIAKQLPKPEEEQTDAVELVRKKARR